MTQGDLLDEFKSNFMKYNAYNSFDYHATDFGELANRESIPFNKAEKSHEIGVELLNTVFKSGQLKIFTGEGSGSNHQLITELNSIDVDTPKTRRVDDAADALRYAIAGQSLRITPLKSIKDVKRPEVTNPRMRFYKGLDRPPESTPWSEYVEQSIEDAAKMFEEII